MNSDKVQCIVKFSEDTVFCFVCSLFTDGLRGKQIYIKKAFECLEAQGLLAIRCLAKPEVHVIGRFVKSLMAQKATFLRKA